MEGATISVERTDIEDELTSNADEADTNADECAYITLEGVVNADKFAPVPYPFTSGERGVLLFLSQQPSRDRMFVIFRNIKTKPNG